MGTTAKRNFYQLSLETIKAYINQYQEFLKKIKKKRCTMKKTSAILTWIGICLIIITACCPLMAQHQLKLTIRTEFLDYFPGFPVIVYVYLESLAYEYPTEVVRCLEPGYGFVEYIVKTPEGKEFTFVPWAYKEHPQPVKTLAGGGVIRKEAKIFFGANGWTFTTPGEYTLKAVYMKEIESNEWPISIVTPYGGKHQEIADHFMGNPEVGYFLLFEGGDHLEEGKKRLELAATMLANNEFGVYSSFVLGANLLQDFANFKEKKLRKANLELAVNFLERARAKTFSFHQAVYTHVYLEEAYRKMGQPERANDVRKDLITRVERKMNELYSDFREYRDFMKDILEQREVNREK
jgi:hypothetical protein